jgi:hypothetical protein
MAEAGAPGAAAGRELRVVKCKSGGRPKTLFIALTDEELGTFIASGGEIEPIRKHILLVVDGHAPSPRDHADAQQAFAQCYTETHTGSNPVQ